MDIAPYLQSVVSQMPHLITWASQTENWLQGSCRASAAMFDQCPEETVKIRIYNLQDEQGRLKHKKESKCSEVQFLY